MIVTGDLATLLICGYLHKNCRGRAAARTQKKIAADFQALGLALPTRDVRDALARLVRAGWPIGTCCGKPKGAFVCETAADFAVGYANLVERVRTQAARARGFRVIAREVLTGQRRFNFVEARQLLADLEARPLLPLRPQEPKAVPAEGGVR